MKFDQNLNRNRTTVSSSGQKMLVQFLTDGENTFSGFNTSFYVNPINKNCTDWLTSDKLTSPNYPKMNCSWVITASIGSTIYIEFERFEVNCDSFIFRKSLLLKIA